MILRPMIETTRLASKPRASGDDPGQDGAVRAGQE